MRLSDCFTELLARGRRFLRRPAESYEEFRGQVEGMISTARDKAQRAGFAEDDFDNGLFAVAAWLDEAIMCSGWIDAERWKKDLLQKKYFNTARAGVEFFKRLDALTRAQKEVREIYYACLLFGFQGQYASDPGTLEALKHRHLELLFNDPSELKLTDETRLFPESYPETAPQAPAKGRRFRVSGATLAWIAAPAFVVLVLYLIYHVVLASLVSGFATFMK